MALLIYHILFFFFTTAFAQLEFEGACNFTGISYNTISAESFLGTWYQLERISNSFEQGDCSTTTITAILSNKMEMEMSHREIRNGKLFYRNGSITPIETISTVPLFNVTYSDGNSYDYAILGSNYEYMVLYSCKTSGTSKRLVWGWKFSRNLTISDEAKKAITSIVSNTADLANATWRVTSNTKEACKSRGGMSLPTPVFHLLILIVIMFAET